MSNLGGYQTMTTFMKSLGGPTKGTLVLLGAGYGVIRLAEAGGKKLWNVTKGSLENRRARSPVSDQSYRVHSEGTSNKGLKFQVGAEFVVLEHDEDAILIELIGDGDNPHVVSGEFLSTISKFKPQS